MTEPPLHDERRQGYQVGSGNTQANYFGPVTQHHGAVPTPAPARSAYLEQVRRIAPLKLEDRDAELSELARFCVEPNAGPYVWWRAGPWAGKSALMSTFVLRPPEDIAERVRIVSFFITARLAAQDTREAFTEVVLEQLAALLGRSLPTVLPESTREAFLLDLMAQAADACQEAGARLVLVVDGLDEDRGVTAGQDAHSIAGLLPADPPAGMRIIVAGRPDPQVPEDVPDWHPLRNSAIVRPLGVSEYARDIARLSRQELRKLLHGTVTEQDVLGLLTAARGGLTARDLSSLMDVPLWDVEDVLHAVAGRTFTSRPSFSGHADLPEVYLLGHEELQAQSENYFGGRLTGYRDRLHAWAAAYSIRKWPADSPEYLLSGYYRLLHDLGDLDRIIEYALDMARHDRMLDLTGGDAAAILETRTALDRIVAQDEPDLTSALILAHHRDYLAERNSSIPSSLPAVWAILGHLTRALALATSITEPINQAAALTDVAVDLALAGHPQQAIAIAAQVDTATRLDSRVQARAKVAAALASTGLRQEVEALAHSITDPYRQADVLAPAAEALAHAGHYEQAEILARSITDPYRQLHALARVAQALAQAGHRKQAAAIAIEAETLARSLIDPFSQADDLTQVAAALAQAGLHGQATALARDITNPRNQSLALAEVAVALIQAGQHEQAETLARTIAAGDYRAGGAARVAQALAEAGRYKEAETFARTIAEPDNQADAITQVAAALAQAGQHEQAETLARTITDPFRQTDAIAQVAAALAQAGQHEQAETLARTITDPFRQAIAIAQVAAALAQAGQHEQAETLAGTITDSFSQLHALAQVARALAQAGHRQRASSIATQTETLARTITDPFRQTDAIAQVAAALAQAGQHEQAETLARTITDPFRQAIAIAQVAAALAQAGQHEQAETLARTITDPSRQVHALAQVAAALAQVGRSGQAVAMATEAQTLAYTIKDSYLQADTLAYVSAALAYAGSHQQAQVLAYSITSPSRQVHALGQVAAALAQGGQHEQAETLARSITDPYSQAQALAQVAAALARTGHHREAETLARSITDPNSQQQAQAQIAAVLAHAGHYQEAEFLALTIASPNSQADALCLIADALTQVGDTRSAGRLAATVCVIGGWTTAVGPVFKLEPSAYVALARAMAEP